MTQPPIRQPLPSVRTSLGCVAAIFVAATHLVARPAGNGAGASANAAGQGTLSAQPLGPSRPVMPSITRTNTPDVVSLNRQSRLERLTNASDKLFDIVPPVPPDLAAKSPLPGYRIVRLGRKHNNRLCFAATVGGTKGLMMLDTGAANTALNGATYRALRLGGSASLPAGVPRALSLNGITTPLAEAPDFRVGPSNLGAVPVSLIPDSYLRDGSSDDSRSQLYDGLLGENILRHYGAMIDCARLVLYLDLDPAKKLDLSASFVRHGWTRVPMTDTGTHFLVPCVLNGRHFRLLVDTGAPFTNLDRALVQEARVPSRELPFRNNLIGRESESVSLVELDNLQIGDFSARDVHMIATAQSLEDFAGHLGHSTDAPVIGLLGGDLLARYGAVIDIGNKALYLKPPAAKSDAR